MTRRQRRRARRVAKRTETKLARDNKAQKDTQAKDYTTLEKRPTKFTRLPGLLWKVAVGIIAIVGFAYQFRPDIDVETDISTDVKDPLATQFRITNEGLLAVYDLTFSCNLDSSRFRNVVTNGNSGYGENPGQEMVLVLASKESTTRNCGVGTDFNIPMNLSFDVKYRPKWFWVSFTKRTRFVSMHDSQGNLKWLKQPLERK